jgi:hypothetical protein
LPQALPAVWILFALPVSWGWFLRCHLDIALLQIHMVQGEESKEVVKDLIGDPIDTTIVAFKDGSCRGNPGPCGSGAWSRFFPVTSLYMILILPCHSYIWSWFFPVTVLYMILNLPRHCIIYDPDSSPSCTALYMIQWRGRTRIIYKTVTGKNQDHI